MQYCRVDYDLGPGTQTRTAISCKLMVQEGMRVTEVAQEIKYCLRNLGLKLKVKEVKKIINYYNYTTYGIRTDTERKVKEA